jgi:glycine/D-amino acid oxidase-like deaminating enzyme
MGSGVASERTEWLIVGGGFAGLAAAAGLGAAGAGPGLVFESEPACGAHASGRNAGILRLADDDPVVRAMARRTVRVLTAPRDAPIYDRIGGLTLAGQGDAAPLVTRARSLREEGVDAELLSMRAARRRFPELE